MHFEGILYGSCWYGILLYFLLRHSPGWSKSALTVLFTTKIAATFTLHAIFTYYYTDRSTADIYRFFDDGQVLSALFFSNPIDYFRIMTGLFYESDASLLVYFDQMNAWIKPFDTGFYNDNRTMIRLNALMALFSFGHPEVHGVVFSFMAFLGLMWICESLFPQQSVKLTALVLSVLFPSSLLWMSGGLKESILLFGLGATMKCAQLIVNHRPLFRTILFGITGAVVLVTTKMYTAALFIPALISYYLTLRTKRPIPYMLGIWLILLSSGFMMSWYAGIDMASVIAGKRHDFLNHIREINPGSTFHMDYLEEGYLAIVKYIPMALTNAILRPWPWEVSSAPTALMLIENLLFLLLIGISLYSCIRYEKVESARCSWVLLFVIPTLILIGMVTPVFGAMMRYRAPAFVMLLICIAPYFQKFVSRTFISRTTDP